MLFALEYGCTSTTIEVRCHRPTSDECHITEELSTHQSVQLKFTNSQPATDVLLLNITSASEVTEMPSGIFQHFVNLEQLELSIGIKVLNSHDFESAAHLQILILQQNQIEILPRAVFITANTLQEIVLSNNKISMIADFAFDGLDRLENIYLDNNSLITINVNTFAGRSRLIGLHLNHNRIEYIEDGAFNLPQLKALFLTHNRIQVLTDNVFSGANHLFALDLMDNRLVSIGSAIYGISSLSALELNNNQIGDLDLARFCEMPALMQLSLRNSGLTTEAMVSAELRSASNSRLLFMDLSSNGLQDADLLMKLRCFGKLEELNLNDNLLSRIDGLDRVEVNFKHLDTIGLSDNRITCQQMESIVQSLYTKGVQVHRSADNGLSETKKNYKGILCT